MKAIPMRVMSEREQADRFKNEKDDETSDEPYQIEDTFPKGDQRDNSDCERKDNDENEKYSDKTCFSGLNSKNRSDFDSSKNVKKKRKRGGLSTSESDSSNHSDSTEIPSEEDDIFFKEKPPYKRLKKNYKARSMKTMSTHSKRELQQSPSRKVKRIQEDDVRSITKDQTPIRRQCRRKIDVNRSKTKFTSKHLDCNSDNIKRNQHQQEQRQTASTSSDSDFDEQRGK